MEITEEEEENKCFSQKFNFDKRFFKTCLILLLLIGLLNSYSKKYKIIINIVKYEDTNKNKTDKDIMLKNKNKDTNKVINRRKNIDKGKVIDSNQATDMISMINMSKEFDAYKSIKTNSFTDMNKTNNIIKSIGTETVDALNKSNYNKDDNNVNNIDNDKPKRKLRVGVIGLDHHKNVGNNLVKYAISIILSTLSFDPHIIGIKMANQNISFLQQFTKVKIINNSFKEINKSEFHILMVNSDQTWRKWDKYFYDIAFLNFAKNWNIQKFIYGASIGLDNWNFTKKDEMIAKNLLKNFTGISIREKSTVNLIKKHLGIIPQFVLDPTFLINKTYYLDLIKDFKRDFNFKEKYLCVYQLDINPLIEEFISEANKKLNYTIYKVNQLEFNYVENFIFAINISEAVITDSFHGTIFSIIFNIFKLKN